MKRLANAVGDIKRNCGFALLLVCVLASCDSSMTETRSDMTGSTADSDESSQSNVQNGATASDVVNGYYLTTATQSYSSGSNSYEETYVLDIDNRTLSKFEKSIAGLQVLQQVFTFDSAGLIVREDTPQFEQYIEATYSSDNRLLATVSFDVTGNGSDEESLSTRYIYDENGLLTSKIVRNLNINTGFSSPTTSFLYDTNNILQSTTLNSPLVLGAVSVDEFSYSPDGARLLRVDSVVNISSYSLGSTVFEYDAN